MSEMTSIKLPVQIRDRLAVAARSRGLTVRALLDEFSRRSVDEALMAASAVDMERLRGTDPAGWASYLAEGAQWEQGTVEQLDA